MSFLFQIFVCGICFADIVSKIGICSWVLPHSEMGLLSVTLLPDVTRARYDGSLHDGFYFIIETVFQQRR